MLLCEQIDYNKIERSAKRLNLMTHPMRVKIIDLLLASKGMSVTEIFQKLKIMQAEASHHLTLLKDFGVINKVREGKKSIYFINAEDYYKTLAMVDKIIGK
jgi:ArsR family transcriptional regulator, zinc-responsive transcriptional repressor